MTQYRIKKKPTSKVASEMLTFIALVLRHVPTYDCTNNCCTPPHKHDISQVIYLKNSGGLEIHLESDTDPINTLKPEIMDVDIVFRDHPDPTTYDVYIGCGGCAQEDVLVDASRLLDKQYESPVVEPFTQTVYRSLFPKSERKLNASVLQESACPEKHFTIRLVRHENATEEIIWGAVVGLKESFTFVELISFPIFILRNHGYVWNQLWWTILIAVAAAPICIYLGKTALKRLGRTPLDAITSKRRNVRLREYAYELAIFGFVIAAIEELIHLVYVQIGIHVESGFYVGLFAVVIFSNGLGIVTALLAWNTMYQNALSSPYWAPLELIVACCFVVLLGAGFYIGPLGLIIAATLRCGELVQNAQPRAIKLTDIAESIPMMPAVFL